MYKTVKNFQLFLKKMLTKIQRSAIMGLLNDIQQKNQHVQHIVGGEHVPV